MFMIQLENERKKNCSQLVRTDNVVLVVLSLMLVLAQV